jgi:CTP synthase (UTP-ammonia lyase)
VNIGVLPERLTGHWERNTRQELYKHRFVPQTVTYGLIYMDTLWQDRHGHFLSGTILGLVSAKQIKRKVVTGGSLSLG